MCIYTFGDFGAFWCPPWEEGNYEKKLQSVVNLTCLGYNTDNKYTNAFISVHKGDRKLRDRNVACYSRKINILDFDDHDDNVDDGDSGRMCKRERNTAQPNFSRNYA